jgi:hypothetical protein
MFFLALYTRAKYGTKSLRRLPGIPIERALHVAGQRAASACWQRGHGATSATAGVHLASEMRRPGRPSWAPKQPTPGQRKR